MFTHLLHCSGAREILGIDIVDSRLDVARKMGASATVNADHEPIAQSVSAWTEGDMADLVIEAVGKDESLNMATDLIKRGGAVAYFGVPKKRSLMINVDDMLRKNLRLITSVDAQSEPGLSSFRLAVRLLAEKRCDLSTLISHVLPLKDIKMAFDLAYTKKDGAVKVVLSMD